MSGLPVAGRWYEVEQVAPGLSRILETHVAPWMRCNMWLVHGRDHDLLIDSGMGLRPIKAEVARLRERPVVSLSTHCHFDHIGCCHEFETRLGHRHDADIHADPDNHRTCAAAWLAADLLTALPHEGYALKDYRITPAPLTGYLDEGDVVDLGDRHFSVLHLPGHAPGSIALYEHGTRTLFSGDVIYDGPLIDNAWHSNPDDYRQSLERLRALPIDTVHGGHEASFGRERLHALIDSYMKGGLRMASVADFLAEQRP